MLTVIRTLIRIHFNRIHISKKDLGIRLLQSGATASANILRYLLSFWSMVCDPIADKSLSYM